MKQTSEFPHDLQFFSTLKERLLSIDFAVYEFIHHDCRRLQPNRKLMLTHEHFRDQNSCTIAAVADMIANPSAFRRIRSIPSKGFQHFIWRANVTIINNMQRCSLNNTSALVKTAPFLWGRPLITALLSFLDAHPTLIHMDHVLVCYQIDIPMPSLVFFLQLKLLYSWCHLALFFLLFTCL